MSHRLIHARPETTHGSGRVEILHISKEKRARRQTRRSGAIWGKMLRMRRTQFSDRVHICAKWRRRRLSTTETRRDLVKLFSAGESLSPVPGFDRGSCVPPDPRSNYAAGLILRMGPAAPCYLTVEAPPQQPLPLPLPLPLPAYPGNSLPRPSPTQPPSPRVTLPCPPPSALVPRPRQPPCAGPRIRAWAP